MENAGEGGAWGIALLALFTYIGGQNLENFLDDVFKNSQKTTVSASEAELKSFGAFMEKYKKGLAVETLASEVL
jgi:hypothetical protein